VIHRDIKPENILLSGDHALVADFGIARPFGSGENPRITETGFSVGTPAYMSPEQALGEALDPRSDLYSLGCVLHEMLAGEPPHVGATGHAILAQRLTVSPPALRTIRKEVPETLERATLRALRRDPSERFATAAEFIAGLTTLDRSAPEPATSQSIAVLPFLNLSPDPENEYFSDGMTEALINALSKVRGMHVVSRTSVFAFKGKQQDIRAIGSQLNVKTVLEGSVRRAGPRLRVAVQLTNVADGYLAWSETFDRDMVDVFAIQDEISQSIVNTLMAGELLPGVGQADRPQLVKPPTGDLEAYAAYLKGRHFWNRRTEGSVLRGLECFQDALGRDPQYAQAWAGIADSYAILGFYCDLPPKDAFPRAREAALRALELDPELAEAHPAIGYVDMYYGWDWAAAEREFQKGIRLNPGYATAHQWYGNFLSLMGRHEEGELAFAEAVRLDPLAAIKVSAVGWGLLFAHRYHDAAAACTRGIELDPTLPVVHWWLGMAKEQLGEWDEAIAAMEEGLRLSHRTSVSLAMLGHAFASHGEQGKALVLLAELEALERTRYVSSYDIGTVLIALGRNDEAIARLRKAFEDRDHWCVLLRTDPRVDPLRSDRRFQDLVDQMKFPPLPGT
jgi:serine/threonine-protein kinase